MHRPGELPSLRATVNLGAKGRLTTTHQWYDVSFYPYTAPGVDPVFAVTGGAYTVVCRCLLQKNNFVEILRWFEDDEERPLDDPLLLNSLAWTQAPNGNPILCVAGNSPHIRLLDIKSGKLLTTLAGHGDHINDLVVSPTDPSILASASYDCSIRIWSLDAAHKNQPLAAHCHGPGHKEGLLTLAYHRKGRYMLSGGLSPMVNLWMIPKNIKDHAGTDKQAMIRYPHFSTTEVHGDFVDCIRFYNDLIISHAAREDRIVIWRIDGFNSDVDPPSSAAIPVSQAVNSKEQVLLSASSTSGTRSAWGGRFQMLLQLYLPDTEGFYIRFSLLHELGMPPVLAAGNEKSRMFFWDLQRLEEESRCPPVDSNKTLPLALARHMREDTASSTSSTAHSTTTGSTSRSTPLGIASVKPKAKSKKKEDKLKTTTKEIREPFTSIEAHKTFEVPKYDFAFRNMSWSRDGKWCVGVGDVGLINICHREDTGAKST